MTIGVSVCAVIVVNIAVMFVRLVAVAVPVEDSPSLWIILVVCYIVIMVAFRIVVVGVPTRVVIPPLGIMIVGISTGIIVPSLGVMIVGVSAGVIISPLCIVVVGLPNVMVVTVRRYVD